VILRKSKNEAMLSCTARTRTRARAHFTQRPGPPMPSPRPALHAPSLRAYRDGPLCTQMVQRVNTFRRLKIFDGQRRGIAFQDSLSMLRYSVNFVSDLFDGFRAPMRSTL
jgi:hypothetical protein